MNKILISIMTICVALAFLSAGTLSFFTDVEISTGNTFTAGTIDIGLNSADGQDVVTIEGDLDLKPCQTGYIEKTVINEGNNPCEVWKHIDNVVNLENGVGEPEQEYYAGTHDPEPEDAWLISDWIHYDMSICRPLDYSYTTTIPILFKDGTTSYDLEVTVEDGDGWQTWKFDFPTEDFGTGDGQIDVGLIIATDGDGQPPAYQIHNNDGVCDAYPWGTWLYSEWDDTAPGNWHGWMTSDDTTDYNIPVSDIDWIEASGDRQGQGTDGILEIKIKKCSLSGTIHWAAAPVVGTGWWDVPTTYMSIPDGFDWSTSELVDMIVPNYIEADIHSGVSIEIDESDGWFLTSKGPNKHPSNPQWGVECKWIYLGILLPGESMVVIQSYHLDKDVENWGQSDQVTFDMEFMAQQIEGELPPPPGDVLSGHGRPSP